MRFDIKPRYVIVLTIVFILSLNNISYGTDMTTSPQIKTRGLIFNTGRSSDQIRLLKDFFRARGDTNVPWGYSYDARTKELVRNYQKLRGLKADGIAGKATIDTINKEIINRKFEIGLRIPYTNVKGEMILINKSSNTIYFLRNGKIESSYPVATGKTIDLTPDGKFKIVIKLKNPGWGGAGISEPIKGGEANNPLGTRWIGISYGGGGQYGVHGNSNPRSIGSYASLGCVRMFNRDVEDLYERVKINTPIWIGSEALLESYGVKFKYNNIPRPKTPKPIKPEIQAMHINILLNGEKLKLENPVINKKGTTYYPFREILESIDASVIWDEANKKVIAILDKKYVEFQLNNNKYLDNEGYKYLPKGQKVFTFENKTYVPIRNLMESLGYDVSWEELSSTVIIEDNFEDEIIEDESEYETIEDESEYEIIEDESRYEIIE